MAFPEDWVVVINSTAQSNVYHTSPPAIEMTHDTETHSYMIAKDDYANLEEGKIDIWMRPKEGQTTYEESLIIHFGISYTYDGTTLSVTGDNRIRFRNHLATIEIIVDGVTYSFNSNITAGSTEWRKYTVEWWKENSGYWVKVYENDVLIGNGAYQYTPEGKYWMINGYYYVDGSRTYGIYIDDITVYRRWA